MYALQRSPGTLGQGIRDKLGLKTEKANIPFIFSLFLSGDELSYAYKLDSYKFY